MPIKAIVDGTEKEITRIPVLADNVYKDAWEVRDNQDRLLWYREDTLTGTSSISYKGYGIPLKSMKVVGNGQQSGTPSPDNIIMPEMCGERTGNLFDDAVYSAYKQGNGTYLGAIKNFYTTHVTPFTSDDIGKTFTFALVIRETTSKNVRVAANINGNDINGNSLYKAGTTTVTFTVSSANDYLYLNYGSGGENPITLDNIMLNSGSTALPYEPYGWKIPLTCAGQTTPLYLGEVSTVRKIRKLVLTGDETSWSDIGGSANPYRILLPDIVKTTNRNSVLFLSTHYLAVSNTESWSKYSTCVSWSFSGGVSAKSLQFRDTSKATLADFKSYLSEQFAAGTPVTVWYVLAEPETAIVNEPLAKIENYADELITVPGITPQTGTNALTVDTTISPSSVSITGHIKEIV
jgi:hypothetical protein